MSIFSRIQKLIEGNINEMIDKVEDPETKINQVIRDLEKGLMDLRTNLASAMAAAKVSEINLREIQEEANEWKSNAKLALESGDESMAKKALEKKIFYTKRVPQAENQLESDGQMVERFKGDLTRLEEKVAEARVKRETLLLKKQSTQNRNEILNTQEAIHQKMGVAHEMMENLGALGEIEKDLIHKEALATAREEIMQAGVEADFEAKMEAMKKDQELNDELAALKKEMESED